MFLTWIELETSVLVRGTGERNKEQKKFKKINFFYDMILEKRTIDEIRLYQKIEAFKGL